MAAFLLNGWSFYSNKKLDIPIINEKSYFSGFRRVDK